MASQGFVDNDVECGPRSLSWLVPTDNYAVGKRVSLLGGGVSVTPIRAPVCGEKYDLSLCRKE